MDDDRTLTNPALDLASRGSGQWWGIAALVASIVVVVGAVIGIVTDNSPFSGISDITTAMQLQYAIAELAFVPVLLTIVSLLVERARLLPLLAAGAWTAAQVLDAVATFADTGNIGS